MDRIHILILDDDIEILESIQYAASDRFCINGFTKFEDMLVFLSTKPQIDLLMVDYHLNSDLNGLDYVKIIRSLTNPKTPCVLFTGAIIKDLEYLSKLNCKVIEKPIMIPHLLDRLVEIYIEHLEGEYQAVPLKVAD